jgi:hypothetical protein
MNRVSRFGRSTVGAYAAPSLPLLWITGAGLALRRIVAHRWR